jgi:hypothetical protein
VDGFWPIFFLAVVLKIPVGLLLYLVWWAFRANTVPEEAPPDSEDHRPRRYRREPIRPRGPRRGPHGPGAAIPLPAGRHEGRTRFSIPPAAARAAARSGRGSAEPADP